MNALLLPKVETSMLPRTDPSTFTTIDPNSDTINITSGVLHAVLHKQRFICPGINRECIEFQGQFITPKTFYVMADKGSLKDWKNAIRIEGKKIRRYIDTGELEFYNHAELCTGRCKSKMGNKTLGSTALNDSLNTSIMSPSLTKKVAANGLLPSVYFDNDHYSSNDSLNLVKEVDTFGDVPDIKPDIEQLRLLNVLNLRQNSDVPTLSGDQAPTMQFVQVTRNAQDEDDEDAMFWRAIVQLGLVDEFFREVKAKLDILKASMIKNYVPVGDAKKASRIVNELGMRSKLDMRLCAHKFEFDRQRDKLEKEMDQLKKKVTEYEHRKEILKQKSVTYEQLMTKKIKLEDMSTSEMQPQAQHAQLEGINQELRQFVVQPSSPLTLLVNGGATKEQSPKLDDASSNGVQDHAKRSRIEGISQELGQFAVQSAGGMMVMVSGARKSKAESPKLDNIVQTPTGTQRQIKRARIEGISQGLSQCAAGTTVLVKAEDQSSNGESLSESPCTSQDSLVTQSQDSSGETLSQLSAPESSTSAEFSSQDGQTMQ